MPVVKNPALLMETCNAVKKNISRIPSQLLSADSTTLYRRIPPTLLKKPAPGHPVSRSALDKFLTPFDGSRERQNRYSGPCPTSSLGRLPAGSGHILCCGGLYCSLQQQALINEMMHYSHRSGKMALDGQAVLKIRLRGPALVADLSPHNPAALSFLQSLGNRTFEQMTDPVDCSVARGIGIAIAHSGYFHGLLIQTVRESDRSDEERGDNVVFFGTTKHSLPCLYVESVQFFNQADKTSGIYPVA